MISCHLSGSSLSKIPQVLDMKEVFDQLLNPVLLREYFPYESILQLLKKIIIIWRKVR